jgi:hypothetical protein
MRQPGTQHNKLRNIEQSETDHAFVELRCTVTEPANTDAATETINAPAQKRSNRKVRTAAWSTP